MVGEGNGNRYLGGENHKSYLGLKKKNRPDLWKGKGKEPPWKEKAEISGLVIGG